MEKMEIWNKVCKTDPETTKAVNLGGRKFTSVCAQFQVKKATELWGSFGQKWGIKDEHFINFAGYMLYQAKLFYPEGEVPIHSDTEIIFRSGKRKDHYNEDWSKKTATDALTKGLSKLGFNSDVFEGKFDDNKYVQQMKAESNPETKEREKLCVELEKIAFHNDLKEGEKKFIDDRDKKTTPALRSGLNKLRASYTDTPE